MPAAGKPVSPQRHFSTVSPQFSSRRALIIGLLLVVLNAYWVGLASELWYAVYTLVSPFSNAVFTLVVLLALNALLQRTAPRAALDGGELLLIYVMVTMVSTISGHAMMAILMGTLAHPFWFASPENQYAELFWRFIPEWATPHDRGVLAGYFRGDSSLYLSEHWQAWLAPVLLWSAFISALYGSLLFAVLLFRRQWSEHDKLSFPLTQLPLQMVTNRSFFRSPALWIGIGVAAFVRVLAGLHDLFPVVPAFPASIRIDPYLRERPWNAMGYISLSFNLAIVGLAYFMPLDLAFSCWFFFWLTRWERVIASVAGWRELYLNERASGAWIGIALIAIWAARRHLGRVFRSLFRPDAADDSREPIPYRWSLIGLGICLVGVAIFCWALGMSWWGVLAFYVLFFLLALALAYVRAGLGPPYHEVIGINPRSMLVTWLGTRRLGGANLTALTLLYAFDRCHRSHPMPNQAEGIRIGERGGIPGRTLVGGMALAIGIGAVATFWAYLDPAYRFGVLARYRGWVGNFGWESWEPLRRWLLSPTPPDARGTLFTAGGLGFVLLLQFLRGRLLWWPLHPSGYVLSGAAWGGMIYFWFPVLVAWAIKSVVLRWGGLSIYRRTQPFFLGLVLGDFVPRSLLSLLSFALNLYMPSAGAGHTL